MKVQCLTCGSIGEPEVRVRGSDLFEALSWLLLFPGIVYSLWRASEGPVPACASCGSEEILRLRRICP